MPFDSKETAEFARGDAFSANFFVPPTAPVAVTYGGGTNVGKVRENNEDHFAVIRRVRAHEAMLTNLEPGALAPSEDEAFCFIVADGMGGAAAGEWASRLALQRVWDLAGQASSWLMKFRDIGGNQVRERISAFVTELHQTLRDYGNNDPKLAGMGTTWTSAYSMGWNLLVVHLGDSRAYLYRGGELKQLTKDHTLAQMLIDKGVAPEETRRVRHILINSLTATDQQAIPDVEHVPLQSGDQILLCSDGLTDLLEDAEIAEVLGINVGPQSKADALIDLALAGGGKDNVTAVVAEFRDPTGK
ncbi:MAG: PP2C family serine/threonine-protein phosphatase [Planctomycetaceae bacterium]